MKKRFCIAVIGAVMVAVAPASAEVTFKHISAEQAARLVSNNNLNSVIADSTVFVMSFHKRTQSGHVERHMGWDEEFVMQEGDELLNYGSAASNPRQLSLGEFTGDTITGGKSVLLHAGDVVVMPAGMWHQHLLKSPTVRYLLFRTRKQPR